MYKRYTCKCSNGSDVCNNGQSCFWFTQGASVGCTSADGNGTRLPNLDHCPSERAAGFDPLRMTGALSPKFRTVNMDSTPGAVEDIWKFNPWRAPGKAPTADPYVLAAPPPSRAAPALFGAFHAPFHFIIIYFILIIFFYSVRAFNIM